MIFFSRDLGVDLGTSNVLIYQEGKGIVLREPSVVAVDRDTNRVLAIGEEARRMIGRTPGNIVAIRPLREGVIADYDITESMLRHFIEQVIDSREVCHEPRLLGVVDRHAECLRESVEHISFMRSLGNRRIAENAFVRRCEGTAPYGNTALHGRNCKWSDSSALIDLTRCLFAFFVGTFFVTRRLERHMLDESRRRASELEMRHTRLEALVSSRKRWHE